MKQANRMGPAFLIPALTVVAVILIFPVLQTLFLSLERNTTTIFGPLNFAGIANYLKLFHSERFLTALGNTLVFAAGTVPLELAFGLGLAVLLNKSLPARGLVRMAILFPWALPTALNALMWRWMFNTEFGFFNAVLVDTGIAHQHVNWLGVIPLAMYSMMAVSIWKTSSFIALLLLAGLQSIPSEVYEAGRVDGTTTWSEFRYITLPLLRPAILVAVLLRTMDALRAFELPFNLTAGGPLTSTETLSLYSYRIIFQYVDFNMGSAAIVIQFVVIMFISLFYIFTIRGDNRG